MGWMCGVGSQGGFRAGSPCSEPWTHEARVWGSGWVTFPGVQPTPSASPRCTPARKSREAPARSSHQEWICQPPPEPLPDALLLPSHLASCLTSRFASRLLPASDLLPLALTSASCLASRLCLGSPCGAWCSQAAPFTPSVHPPLHKHPEHHLPSPPCAQTPDTVEQGRGGRGSWTWGLQFPGVRARAPPRFGLHDTLHHHPPGAPPMSSRLLLSLAWGAKAEPYPFSIQCLPPPLTPARLHSSAPSLEDTSRVWGTPHTQHWGAGTPPAPTDAETIVVRCEKVGPQIPVHGGPS